MNRILIILLSLTVLSTSCGSSPEAKSEEKSTAMPQATETAITAQVVNKADPVCGMALMEHPGDTSTYNGSLYGFCSEHCKTEFLKDPSSYMAKSK